MALVESGEGAGRPASQPRLLLGEDRVSPGFNFVAGVIGSCDGEARRRAGGRCG